MNHFVIVKTDACTIGEDKYIIHTSINVFIYKIEVFKNEVLIDTIETNSVKKEGEKLAYKKFVDIYEKAHKGIRDKYCHRMRPKTNHNEVSFEKKDNMNFFKKVTLWGVVWGLIVYILMVKVLIYSDIYIDNFLVKKEKIAYLEKVESVTHRLEKECMFLSKKQLNRNMVANSNSCEKWCDKGIIVKETCDLFLAYFFTNSKQKLIKTDSKKIVTAYEVFPKQSLIELNSTQTFQLKIQNKSNHKIFVSLIDIVLDHNCNEEIVQFEKAKISFSVEEEEERIFHIFLEPSYYKQFELGKYTGSLMFEVKYKNKSIGHIKQQLYFMVK